MAFNFFGILKGLLIENEVDRTKQVLIQSSSASTTNTTTTITTAQTANRTLTLPDASGTLTVNDANQVLENKTLLNAKIGDSTTNDLENSLQYSTLASTPSSNPPANYLALYPKADGFLYTLNSVGTEISVSQQPIANNRILANISGVSAIPVSNTLTGIIDSAVSNTQGSVLYRNASAWVALPPGTSGQALVTAGAAANPAWAGVGSVTSVATGTGLTGGPITSTGTISLANIASNTLLANTTGGSATPTANSISSVIDNAISSTQGSILYRNASGWVALPPGTSGQLLRTQGVAANPIWATGSGASGDPNTVAFFDGSGTLTDQTDFSWDGTNLGIGVTATNSKARIHADSTTTSGTVGTGSFIFGRVHTTRNIGSGSFLLGSQTGGGGVSNSCLADDSLVSGRNNFIDVTTGTQVGSQAFGQNHVLRNCSFSTIFGDNNQIIGVSGSGVESNFIAGSSNTINATDAAATGSNAIFGEQNNITTNAEQAFTAGKSNTVTGKRAASFGESSTAQAYASMTLGRFNVLQGTSTSWVSTDDVLVIGNGTGSGARANAFKVVKDGTAVINTVSYDSGGAGIQFTQSVGAGGQISTSGRTFIKVAGSGVLTTPSLSNGTYEGQIVIILNADSVGNITLVNSTTVKLPAASNYVLAPQDTISLIWNAFLGRWYTISASNN